MIPALYQPPAFQEFKTAVSFQQNQIQNEFDHLHENTIEYIEGLNKEREKVNLDIYYKFKFDELYSKVIKETLFSSSSDRFLENSNFKKITSFGYKIVPAILEEIRKKPSNIVWALNIITNQKISAKDTSIEEACQLWVNWGKKNKFN